MTFCHIVNDASGALEGHVLVCRLHRLRNVNDFLTTPFEDEVGLVQGRELPIPPLPLLGLRRGVGLGLEGSATVL